MTPILSTSPMLYVPRPDRLYSQITFNKRQAQVDVDLLQDILAEYGLRMQAKVKVPIGRSGNVIVKTSAGKKILKRYKDTLVPAAFDHEHSILNYLAQIDFPAPRLTPTLSGETLIQKGGSYYALFDFLEGYFQYHNYFLLPIQTQQFIVASGKALAALHHTLQDFTPMEHHPNGFKSKEGDRWREITWFSDKLDWCRRQMPTLHTDEADLFRRMISEHADRVEAELLNLNDRLARAELPRLIIHSDYGPYNLLFKQGAHVVILDFELTHLDWRLADLCMAVPAFATTRLGFSFRKMKYFLAAYQSSYPIHNQELELFPAVWQFLTLRRIIFCWYRYCDAPSQRWLNEAMQKLKLAQWLTHNQQTLTRWLMDV